MKVKVDILVPYLSGNGGIETVVSTVMQHFQSEADKNRFVYRLVIPQGVVKLDWLAGINNIKLNQMVHPSKVRRQILGTLYLAKYIKENDVQIIVCLSTRLVKMAGIFRRLFHKSFKIVSWIHFSLYHEAAVEPKDLLLADFHLAISSGIAKQIQDLGIESKKIALIYNPLIQDRQPLIPNSEVAEFIYVGRLILDGQKNLSELINALKLLNGDWHFTFYGDGKDRTTIQQLLIDQKLSDHVTFKGWLAQPWLEVSAASAFVLTSKYEGFPMALLESIAHGVPCIASNCPTGPDDIINIDNGRLYQSGNVSQLASLLQQIIDQQLTFDRQRVQATAGQFSAECYFKRFENAMAHVL